MKLVIVRDGQPIAGVDCVGSKRRARVGTRPGDDLLAEDDEAAAGLPSLEFSRRGDLWRVRSLGEGGVRVNGETLESHVVENKDSLTFGSYEVKVVLNETETKARSAPDADSADPALATQVRAHLELEVGGAKSLVPLDRDAYVIGKDPGADLRLAGWNAPGVLALITRGLGGFTLVNVSGGAVFHNAKPVDLRVQLNDRDRLELRDVYATFRRGPIGGKA